MSKKDISNKRSAKISSGTDSQTGYPEMDQLNRELQMMIEDTDYSLSYSKSADKIDFISFLADKLLVIEVIRKGIPYSMFDVIQKFSPFSMNDWADYLGLSGKSLLRYKQQNKSFKSIHSEKIIELAEVTEKGVDVFGDPDKFRLWLDTPLFALGKQKPFDLLKDSYGKEMIMAELIRIEHGILV